ncbi:MAG TPA: ABC transporter permease subunit [Anaerolineaceae bacterium]|nr:ABC transporter permease subunit [Anaerolineaceae bacterium]
MKTTGWWNRTLKRWWQPVGLIIQRELTEQARDWRVVVPMLSFGLVFPFFLSFMARQMVGFAERQGMMISSERVALFLLLTIGFFPVAMALPIAFEAFAGEKERGSLETLLHAPVSDTQLFLANLTSAVLPALASTRRWINAGLSSLGRAV